LITFRKEGSRSVAIESNGQQHFCQQRAKKRRGKWPSRPFLKWLSGLSFRHMLALIVVIIIIVAALWITR
jgi:hypothetical protein